MLSGHIIVAESWRPGSLEDYNNLHRRLRTPHMYNLQPEVNQITIKNLADRHRLDITLTPTHWSTTVDVEDVNMPAGEALRNTVVCGLIFLVIFIIATCAIMLANPVCFKDLLVCVGLKIKERAEEELYVFNN